ncbi:BamA/TamA family outer membrane protein [Piscinibacter sp. XHJ-5]|uniref:autotransporter assembly complex protein TamA n=1 Tax=Piscinibacter sp. XHJ-5 TaxID=3037797 RepID=UPI002453639D|nr:BamA/TamA family outer membrane protein [Piscinibacter sp. XHJ-5]
MSWRALRFAALVALLTWLLAGCSSLPFWSKKSGEAAARPAPPTYQLEVEAPGNLRQLLQTYLDLARFQSAPETETITGVELDRLVAASPSQVRSLLETEGYFNADVRVSRSAGASGLDVIRVSVVPGPRATIEKWQVDVTGELQKSVQADNEDAVVELAALRRRWPLKGDEPFRQAAWNEAKNVTIARLRAEGYPAATWLSTTARVDAQTNSVQLQVVADSGPLYKLGPITIEGLQRYDERDVRRLTTFHPGQPYSEQLLLDYQERLQKVGLFEGAVVEIDPDPATHQAAPVRIRVKELPLQQATAGVGYSANVGPRLTLEHVHRRVFGQRMSAKNKFELGPSLKSWQGELTSHPLVGLYRNLLSGSAEHLEAADEVRNSWTARVGRTQETPHIERLYFAELTHARLDTAAGSASSEAVSLNYHWIWRRVDSVLLPTKGITLSLQGAGGYAIGRDIQEGGITEGRGPFTRAFGRFTWYRPIPNDEDQPPRWYLTARAEAGQVFAADHVGVPDTLLFRAGGDESVRGYAYRTLGPIVNGVITSGRVMATGSVEVARPISPKRPQFLWAVFVDAGQAADHWPDLDPVVGYGVGLRWRSPVGPLRVDLAYGQEIRKLRLHLSVGIAF